VPSSTIIDLGRLALSHGEGARLDLPVRLDPLELGGQLYALAPDTVQARIDVSRPGRGYAFRLRFPMRLAGPCMRCLEPAQVEAGVDAREIDQRETEDEELRSPYVEGEELDVGHWAHDAAVLALPLPVRILCRPDCAGLCPVCGEPLDDAGPAAHEHDTAPDPRWDKLKDLKLD
jgi:uncharacterized protein